MVRKSLCPIAGVLLLGLLVAADTPEVAKLKADLQTAAKQINALQTELKAKDAQAAKAQRELEKMKTDLVTALKELREKDAAIRQLEDRVKSDNKLADELKQTQKEFDRVSREAQRAKFDLQSTKDDLNKSQANLNKTQKELDSLKNSAFVHQVVFYLKKDAPEDAAELLLADVHGLLAKISSVRGLWVGKPAEKANSDSVVKDFHVGVFMLFDDAAAAQKYHDDPKHRDFVEKHSKNLEKVVVYDVVREKAK